MSWGDLHSDLLSAIFQNMTDDICYLPDLYRCLHVCSFWRHEAKKLLHSSAGPVPWLLIPWGQPDKLAFDNTIAFDDSMSSIVSHSLTRTDQRMTAYASYGAWLLLGPRYALSLTKLELPVFLYNPLSRVLIKLPPLPTHLRFDNYEQFVMSETSPRDPKCIVCVWISPQVLAFCKPSQGCSSSVLSSSLWVLSENPASFESDVSTMIFHKGNFYTLNHDCALYVQSGITDFIINDNSGTTNTDMRTWPWPVIENKVALGTYRNYSEYQLVESKNGELLMIERILDQKSDVTTSFRVYKLTIQGSNKDSGSNNNYDYYWKEVNRLEEHEALYFGWHDSFSLYANVSDGNNINTCKPNCIYFFDKVFRRPGRYGVYDLENNSIQHWDDNSDG